LLEIDRFIFLAQIFLHVALLDKTSSSRFHNFFSRSYVSVHARIRELFHRIVVFVGSSYPAISS
jgi:hypothetical protein